MATIEVKSDPVYVKQVVKPRHSPASSQISRAANDKNLAGLCVLSYKHEILLRCSILYHY